MVIGDHQPEGLDSLVERAQAGDRAAFADLLDRFEGKALSIARQLGLGPEDAQDAVQDAFLKLFRYLHRFRTGESFINWFYRIVVNACRDHLRRNPRRADISLDDDQGIAAEVADDAEGALERAEARRLQQQALAALGCLAPKERTTFVLRELQGLDTLAVARAMRVTRVTVRRHVSNARRKIRERLAGQFPDLFPEDQDGS